MQKITPFLWFNNQAEDAVKFYASIFKGTKIKNITRYGKNMPGPEGSVMTISFKMLGQEFTAINGGPIFKFTEAISFVVNCKSQKEVDKYWKKLTKGGKEVQCGWLKDKYGLSWQVVPTVLVKYLSSKNKKKAQAASAAMMKMVKIDIKTLKKAYEKAK